MNHYCVLVIYNMDINQSKSYQFLKNQKENTVIVCDNSEKENKNDITIQKDHQIYINMNGNKGLSYAYNQAINYIEKVNPNMKGKVTFFDDDTIISEDFFIKMSQTDKEICLPVVSDGNSLLSPSMFKNGKSIRIKNLEQLDMKYISGINSGMTINLEIFKDYRYNESLFLDYVDHYFLYEMKQKKRTIEVVDTQCIQNFSANGNDKESDRKRFAIFKKDSKTFYKLTSMKGYYKVIGRRIFRLWLKYKDFSMFKD